MHRGYRLISGTLQINSSSLSKLAQIIITDTQHEGAARRAMCVNEEHRVGSVALLKREREISAWQFDPVDFVFLFCQENLRMSV